MGRKRYLGDAVYGEFSDYGELILTTSDGITETNRIVIDDAVLVTMEAFIAERRAEVAQQNRR